MKKFVLNFALLFSIGLFSNNISAQIREPLPENVLEFLTNHFGLPQIVFQDRDAFDGSYIIQLDNGFETDFFQNGLFKLIDGNGQEVPPTIIADFPEKLRDYLKTYYPNKKIVVLRQDFKHNIDITFADKITAKFDKYGKFLSEEKGK